MPKILFCCLVLFLFNPMLPTTFYIIKYSFCPIILNVYTAFHWMNVTPTPASCTSDAQEWTHGVPFEVGVIMAIMSVGVPRRRVTLLLGGRIRIQTVSFTPEEVMACKVRGSSSMAAASPSAWRESQGSWEPAQPRICPDRRHKQSLSHKRYPNG